MIFIVAVLEYKTDKQVKMLGDKKFTVINKIPVFCSAEERKLVLQGVESGLYNIFRKYMS